MSRRTPRVRRRICWLAPVVEGLEGRALLAPLIYAESDESKLYTVDVATGSAHFVADTAEQLTDLAFDADGRLFGVDLGGALYRVDADTGATTAVGRVGAMLNALAFAPDGTLYGAGDTGLFAIDPATGSGRLVADLHSFPSAGDLTFDAAGDLVLSTSNPSGPMVRIDTGTGHVATVGNLGSSDVFGLAYGPDGVLYAATYGTRQFLSVDPENGKASPISTYAGDGLTRIDGVAFSDEARRPAIRVADASATAPASGSGALEFTVSLAYASGLPVSVSYATADGAATAGTDYAATSGTVTFAPGETTHTVSVPISARPLFGPTKTLQLAMSDARNGLLATASAAGTIHAAPAAPTVSLAIGGDSFDEDGGVATVTATLSAASGSATTVDLGFSGSAVAGANFTASAASIVIPAGATSASITLTGRDDGAITGPLLASVSIAGATGATPSGARAVSATETDATTAPGVSVAPASAPDVASALTFVVTLSKALASPVSVDYSTQAGTATDGLDFGSIAGTLSFAPGETRKEVHVPLLNDPAYKPDKTLSLVLANPIHATLSGGPTPGTILNTAPLPTISVEDVSKAEGRRGPSPAVFAIHLSGPSELPVSIVVETRDGSARSGKDYSPVHTTVTFLPGETSHAVSVPVLGNRRRQRDRSFTLDLDSASGATVSRGQAVGTIVDDDGPKRAAKPAVAASGKAVHPKAVRRARHGGVRGR